MERIGFRIYAMEKGVRAR